MLTKTTITVRLCISTHRIPTHRFLCTSNFFELSIQKQTQISQHFTRDLILVYSLFFLCSQLELIELFMEKFSIMKFLKVLQNILCIYGNYNFKAWRIIIMSKWVHRFVIWKVIADKTCKIRYGNWSDVMIKMKLKHLK